MVLAGLFTWLSGPLITIRDSISYTAFFILHQLRFQFQTKEGCHGHPSSSLGRSGRPLVLAHVTSRIIFVRGFSVHNGILLQLYGIHGSHSPPKFLGHATIQINYIRRNSIVGTFALMLNRSFNLFVLTIVAFAVYRKKIFHGTLCIKNVAFV